MSENNNAAVQAADSKSNFGKKGWIMILYLFLGFFLVTSLGSDLMNVIIPQFVAERGMDATAMYGVSTIAAIIYCIIIVILGFVVKVIGARSLSIICSIVTAGCLCLWPMINSTMAYLILRSITIGAISGVCYVANGNITANWFPTKKGLVMGWATMGATTSTIVAVAIFSALYSRIGFAAPYYFWALICVVVLLMGVFFVRNNPEEKGYNPDNNKDMTYEDALKLQQEGEKYQKTSQWTVKKMLTTRHMWLIGFGTGPLLLFSVGVMSTFISRAMELGFTQTTATLLMSVTAVIGLFGSYICGVLDTKFGTKKAVIMLYVWIIVGLFLNILASKSIGFYYVSIVMLACAIGGANNFPMSMISTVFGRYDFANAYRTTWPLIQLISSFSFSLVGGIASLFGGAYTTSYILVAIVCVIAIILTACISNEKVGR